MDAVLSLSTSVCLSLLLCVSLELSLSAVFLCISVFSPHVCLALPISLGFFLQLFASVSRLLPLSPPCSWVLFIYRVCFPLAVKDLDTEKYFHLVSALPPALRVPAPHWEWTWPPAALGLWRPCSQAWGRLGWGVCRARRPRGPGRASQGRLRVVPGTSTDRAPASQVLPTDELAEPKKAHRQSHRKKVLPEIYLTRLLSTKVLCPHSRGSAGSTRWGRGDSFSPAGPAALPA